MTDHDFMAAALAAAEKAQGRTSPNPPVGAVIVQDGTVIAEGWTQPAGSAHAEVMALRAAGTAARGATLYVTLEPCTIHGRTPACTDAIMSAGITRVVIASRDPNPRFERDAQTVLEAAGIEVMFDQTARPAAEAQTEAFRHWVTTGRPFVSLKYAMTLDGKIATYTGDARWITSAPARAQVHEQRDRIDALLVGLGTVLADDPQLTTRLEHPQREVKHPLRIVLDSRGRMPLTARMLHPDTPGKTMIVTTHQASEAWCAAIPQPHEVVKVAATAHGQIDLHQMLAMLGQRDITSLLIEGGSAIIASFVSAKLINKYYVWIAPKLIGGVAAPGPVGGQGHDHMALAEQLTFRRIEHIGPDLLAVAYPDDQG